MPEERKYWDLIIARASDLARRYGFQRINIPVIEKDELFSRGVGTASDFFVKKEMYSIDEDDGSRITLRPEFTAGMVRAYFQNGMSSWPQPVKIYSIGPVFRRERPQAGRFRQHSQFNPEILGEMDPAADAEIMLLTISLYQELGYKDLTFQLNSTGCPICKPGYVAVLREYLEGFLNRLTEIDRERLKRNPLRILDSKEEGMEELLANAPKIIDYLCDDCSEHFAELLELLDTLGQSYTINFRLVRGIDYYTKTVFELWDKSIGAQAALVGGGRYDGLAEAIGGPPTPGVGCGIGIERIVIGMMEQGIEVPDQDQAAVLVAHFGGETKKIAMKVVTQLRNEGVDARLAFARYRRSMKSQMREADRQGVAYTIIIGDEELKERAVTVRRMDSGLQEKIALDKLTSWVKDRNIAISSNEP